LILHTPGKYDLPNMNLPLPRRFLYLAAAFAGLLLTLNPGRAQYPFTVNPHAPPEGRDRRVELYVLGQYWHAEDGTAENVNIPITPGENPLMARGDVKVKFDDTLLWGFGAGYNLNSHFAVNGEFSFGYSDYSISFNESRLSGEAFVHSGKFNLDYNILPGAFTPFISGGLGYLYLDSQVPSGSTEINCWWDYWWGYDCVGDTPTYSKVYFALNGLAGLRWDLSERMFLKASVGSNWVAVDNAADWISTIQGTLVVGWKF
jgi:hypothetical protein